MARIPPGSFDVKDQVTTLMLHVTVSEFLISAAEITQRQYEEITGANPSFYKGANRPVENVTWWDAIRYCNLRSIKEGLEPCYHLSAGTRATACRGYRLPTEAEWIRSAGPVPPKDALPKAAHLGAPTTNRIAVLENAMKAGTASVASLAPNSFGVYDLYGNVWEWCEDFWDPVRSPDSVFDPYGPARGLMRVVRGGSFASTTSSWGREYRSAMDPSYKSRFTGFRVVVGATGNRIPAHAAGADWFARYNQRPPGYERSTGGLSSLASTAELKSKWASILNEPKFPSGSVPTRLIAEMSPRNFQGRLFEIETEPGVWEKIYVLHPANRTGKPLPVVIVPFYDIDVPAGADFGGRNYSGVGVNAFAYSAAQRGYLAVAVRWFGESDGESASEAVANLAIRHPGATGLGKWIADARRVVDFIRTLPGADPNRIAIFGHSLGGKMALYAAAFEPRIVAAVASEPGIAFKFSNYEDYWYLGDRLQSAPAGTDQHELLALIAPRPFLLIGGDKYDTSESWNYINAARGAYELLGKPLNIGYFNHHSGHTPSAESVSAAFDWLDHFLQ